MNKAFKTGLWVFVLLCVSIAAAGAQDMVRWTVKSVPAGDGMYEVVFDAKIGEGWHLYDMGPYDDMGPNPTVFTFEPSAGVALVDGPYYITEPVHEYDPIFEMNIGFFEHAASFGQKVRLTAPGGSLNGTVEWMVCNDTSCSPPQEWEFGVTLGDASAVAQTAEGASESRLSSSGGESLQSAGRSLWGAIIEAILWGFAALLTPCVFPMVPMTVSFFLKGSENKAAGRFRAAMYGIFIVALYTLPIAAIILITRILGGDAVTADIFNWLATHWIPNLIFFAVFMIFAASFFGAFEITMPSKLVNRSDRKADKGGLGGTFFMALTLVLVSFSCTGPIVGSVLIKSTAGEFWEPIVTMLAFSIAFALPFTVFALFPSWLKKLPKSGGWLNSVKVVLGFIELALGLKFLSVADQTYHWGILDREVYLALWIVIFSLLGFYLLGKLRFKHDSESGYVSVTRLVLSIIVFSFVVYMVPGMWGAPLKALSGYMPPITSQDFVLGPERAAASSVSAAGEVGMSGRKYADFLHLPHGLNGFFDYDEALEYSRKVGKPLFVDFTGHGCVNCREMEARVWSDPAVLSMLRDDYVVLALYSDDKKIVPEEDWVTTPSGKVLKGLGKINSYFAKERFGVNAQPYYILLDSEGRELVPPRGYNLDVAQFVEFLRSGLEAYKAGK